jgi:hypothetical protein
MVEVIHHYEGHDVKVDYENKLFLYKEFSVPIDVVIEALNSGIDRIKLDENLILVKKLGIIEFGCLTMTRIRTQKLKELVCKRLNKPKEHGMKKRKKS